MTALADKGTALEKHKKLQLKYYLNFICFVAYLKLSWNAVLCLHCILQKASWIFVGVSFQWKTLENCEQNEGKENASFSRVNSLSLIVTAIF